MTIQWLFLIAAVVLLVPPLPVGGSVRRFLRSRRNPMVKPKHLLGRWQNWVDLVRALVGVYLLMHLAVSIDPDVKGGATRALMVQAGVLGLGLLFQSIRSNNGIVLVAPVFYLSGITLIVGNWDAGGFAVLVGWMFSLVSKSPIYLLPTMVVALGGSGYLLGLSLPLIMNCGLIVLPLGLSFVFHKQLAFLSDEPRSLAE